MAVQGLSIQVKLPLLIGGLLVAVTGIYSWAAYQTMQRSASATVTTRLGTVRSFHFPNAVLEVRREEAAATSARLLAALPVADLSIEDPPIEDVIRQAFAQGLGDDA